MKTINGPSIHLAQFSDVHPPFNRLASIASWAAGLGFKAVQIPAWDQRLFDIETAAESQTYCDDIAGILGEHGLVVSELTTHILGQLVAVHPAYDMMCDAFVPEELRGNSRKRSEWAIGRIELAAKASRRLGLTEMGTFSGSFLWPYFFPFPQRPADLVEAAFDELTRRWKPVLDACDEEGVNLCYELHPSEDLHDGVSFEMLLERLGGHRRCRLLYDPSHFVLQQLKYLDFIDIYHDRIGMFHVKDAEFNPTGRQGLYGGYRSWIERAGRFRSLGDGQVDFSAIFSKLAQYDFAGWATLEWECCLEDQEDGAREGAAFIRNHTIRVTGKDFDDFAGTPLSQAQMNAILGIS
jgi:sugar phosphate isomerase/epimerase